MFNIFDRRKNYPLNEAEPFKDFKDMLAKRANDRPNRPAFLFTEKKEDRCVSYKEFEEEVNALGTALAALGIHGKHIAMAGENCYNWILTYLTVLASDNVFIPIDKDMPKSDIIKILNESDCEAVFFTTRFEEFFRSNASNMPKIKHFFCYGAEGACFGNFFSAEQLKAEGKKLLNQGDTGYTSQEPDDAGLGEIIYTSGTTGTPKGVMLTRHNLVSSVYYGTMVASVGERGLSVLPYNHCYEAVCDILVSLHSGATICINENLKTIADNLKKYKPDYIMLVPLFVESFYKKIWKTLERTEQAPKVKKGMRISNALRQIGIDKRDKFFAPIQEVFGGRCKKIVCGGAPIRPEYAAFFDAIGIILLNGYGITECSPLVSVNRERYNDFRSVGVALPCCEIKIDSPNKNGEGEICVKGDIVFSGYYKNPDETAKAFAKGGWFRTGDYGKIIKDQLFITGRKKNLIVLKNGKNVYPEEIEEYLRGIPEITEVVVYSIRDAAGEESGLCAEIYPDPEFAEGKTCAEMEDFFSKKAAEILKPLPLYKQIKDIVVRGKEFDHTTSKKIIRRSIEGRHKSK